MSQSTPYRRDIQALRGIAVLLVLVQHSKVPLFHGGYLGVDIFFVISGYLITSLVARDIHAGTFAFAAFYWRRARRLLPAAYTVLLLCVAVSPFLLTDIEMRDFVKQVVGAVSFTANIVLWLQTGYFERAADIKPLLHFWSLSIEEQYYLLLPATLVLAPRRFWLPGAILMTAASLAVCLFATNASPSAAFYLLPTRAWEMGIGSVLAIWRAGNSEPPEGRSALNAAPLLVLLAIAITPLSAGRHPSAAVLVACIATAALIAWPTKLLSHGFGANTLAWFGDRSYSLYLVHWPVFAFLNSASLSDFTEWRIRFAGLVASVVLAVLLYWAVEQRFRIRNGSSSYRPRFAPFVYGSFAIVAAALGIATASRASEDFASRAQFAYGLRGSCDNSDFFVAATACRTATSPRVLIWGDSFAMHLVPGLAASADFGLVQATRALCAPVLGVAVYGQQDGPTWADTCIRFNQQVFSSLSDELRNVDVVVLSSQWAYLLNVKVQLPDGYSVLSSEDLIVKRMRDTIAQLRALGKRVVLVSPPPHPGFEAGRCNERRATGLWSFGAPKECDFLYDQPNTRWLGVDALLKRLARESDTAVVSFDSVICDLNTHQCVTRWDKTFLYAHTGHLTNEGSIAIAKRMSLARMIGTMAR